MALWGPWEVSFAIVHTLNPSVLYSMWCILDNYISGRRMWCIGYYNENLGGSELCRANMTFKYIWTNHLSKKNRGCILVGTKHWNNDNKTNNITTTILDVCSSCSPTIFVWFYDLVYVILGTYWRLELPRFMDRSKYTELLVARNKISMTLSWLVAFTLVYARIKSSIK